MEPNQNTSQSLPMWAEILPHPDSRDVEQSTSLEMENMRDGNSSNSESNSITNDNESNIASTSIEINTEENNVTIANTGGFREWIREAWRKSKRHQVNEQLKEAIKFDHKVGLIRTGLTEEGKVFTTKRATVAFLFVISLAAFDVYKGIYQSHFGIHLESSNKTSWFFELGYQVAFVILLLSIFAFVTWFGHKMEKATTTLRQTPPPTKNTTRVSGKALRISSLAMAVLFAVGGFTVQFFFDKWDMQSSFIYHGIVVLRSILPERLFDNSVYGDCPSANATLTPPTLTFINNTTTPIDLVNHHNHMNLTGINLNSSIVHSPNAANNSTCGFTMYPNCERAIFAAIGIIVCVIMELYESLVNDWLLLSSKTIWAYVEDLDVSELYLTFGEDGPLESEEELARKRELAKEKLWRSDDVMDSTENVNEMLGMIIPGLLLTFAFMMSNFFQLYLILPWFMAIYYGLKVLKALPAFYYAIRIVMKVDEFKSWLASRSGKELLGLNNDEFRRRVLEYSVRSFGVGTGVGFINVKLLGSLAAILASNFFIILQSVEATSCDCD